MPRVVSAAEKAMAVRMMADGIGQREIARRTGLSRPYLRKLAKGVGHQFRRNGVEILGKLCMCANCSSLFRRPPSKVRRAKRQFCDDICKKAFMKGSNHPAWKTGERSKTFSQWILNQASYTNWREQVLDRDGYKCVISGRTTDLAAHHILPKAEGLHPSKALDVSNGITVNKGVHEYLHKLIHEGADFDEAIDMAKEHFNKD